MIYSKFAHESALKRQSEKQSEAYELGFSLGKNATEEIFDEKRHSLKARTPTTDKKQFKINPDLEKWFDYRDGMLDKQAIEAFNQFNKLNLAGFTYELNLLCKRYGVIAKDNSCCDHGGDVFICNDLQLFPSDI